MRAVERRFALLAGLFAGVFLVAGTGRADDTVYLLNGESIQGNVIDVDAEFVMIAIGSQQRIIKVKGQEIVTNYTRIPLTEVSDIQLESGKSLVRDKDVYEFMKARRQKNAQVNKKFEEEAKEKARQKRLERQGVYPSSKGAGAGPAGGAEGAEPEPSGAEPMVLQYTAVYENKLHGFKLRYPGPWSKPEQAQNYWVFRGPDGLWMFNVSFFERYDVKIEELKKVAREELEGHIDYYRPITTGPKKVEIAGVEAERVSGFFEKRGALIRHEQVIVETRQGNLLLIHFFCPGAGEGPVPEFEAVLRSIEFST